MFLEVWIDDPCLFNNSILMYSISLNINFFGQYFSLDSRFGFLLNKSEPFTSQRDNVEKVKLALIQNHNPYQLNLSDMGCNNEIKRPSALFLMYYSKFLIRLNQFSFLMAKLFTFIGPRCFEDTAEAIRYFYKMHPGESQKELCLPRALFAASTSKKFKSNGVIFIGVFLPSKNMHAWIIEGGYQPDPFDNIWINFQPVAALYY